jgi:type I restriction enzyme, S subunit
VPGLSKQRAIADRLADTDALISGVERLITKTQAIKQGMLQQLLGSEAASQWPQEEIRVFASIGTGSRDTKDRVPDGRYPFFVRSQQVEHINSWSFDGEAVLTAGDGVGTGKVFHYINGRFDYHQRVYRISNFRSDVSGRYFFHQFSRNFLARIELLTAKSSVDSVRMETIAGMRIPLPEHEEQDRIAAMIDDAELETAMLQKRLDKAKSVKTGMMQQLLTGRARLPVEPP